MTVAIETLPWSALQLQAETIPWPELDIIAEAIVESADARDELIRRGELELSRQVSADQYDASDLTDLASAAVLALTGHRLEEDAKRQAADYLLHMLKRAAETGEDFLEEAAERSAGRLGPVLVAPLMQMIEAGKCGLHCWFSAFGLLCVAEEADAATQQEVARFCRRFVRECPDRFETLSLAVGPAWALAAVKDRESLPLLKGIFEESQDRQLSLIIRGLQGHEPDWSHPPRAWHVPVRDWLPDLLMDLRDAAAEEKRLAAALGGLEITAPPIDADDETDYTADWQLLLPSEPVDAKPGAESTPARPIWRDAPRVSRNDPCPCGSGKKFKKCCGK